MAKLEFDKRPTDMKQNRRTPFAAIRIYPESNQEITDILWIINCFKDTAKVMLNSNPAHLAIIMNLTDENEKKEQDWIHQKEED
jgi:hypothetical protein